MTPMAIFQTLIEAAKTNRYGHRDATMLLLVYRHRCELPILCALEWSQVDFNGATLHARRARMASQLRIPSGATKCAHCASSVFVNE
jgi:hypothetical protein